MVFCFCCFAYACLFTHLFDLYVPNTVLAVQKIKLSRSLQMSKEDRHRKSSKCDKRSVVELERPLEENNKLKKMPLLKGVLKNTVRLPRG